MDEAENLCDRIAVIDDKRVVALDTPEGLIQRYAGEAEVTFSAEVDDLSFLLQLDEVHRVDRQGRRAKVTGTGPLLARVAAEIVRNGIVPVDLEVKRATLEDVFLAITEEAR